MASFLRTRAIVLATLHDVWLRHARCIVRTAVSFRSHLHGLGIFLHSGRCSAPLCQTGTEKSMPWGCQCHLYLSYLSQKHMRLPYHWARGRA